MRAGHYDGTVFHRVIPGFMVQGGGFTPEIEEKPTRAPIRNEAQKRAPQLARHRRHGPDERPQQRHRQFFINVRDNHRLDFGIGGAGYAVFGQVIDGMDVVDRIAAVPTTSRGPHQNVPQVAVVILMARGGEAPRTAGGGSH